MISKEVEQYYTDNILRIEEQYDAADKSGTIHFMSSAIKAVSHGKAIDLGAGMGHYAAGLAKIFEKVVAAEPVEAMRERGTVKFPDENIRWAEASLPDLGEEITAQRGTFDMAIALGVWHYLSTPLRVLSLMAVSELVKPGGRFEIIYPYPPSRDHQFAVPPEETFSLIEGRGEWKLRSFERLPYPVKNNAQALRSGAELMAFDMERT